MARSRNIKPAIMDNEELAELPFEARLLFIYLWMLADREGRLEDRPKRIAAQALPYDRDVDVINTLTLLQRSGFIERYEAQGSRYIQITGFTKHQVPHHKEAASEIPPPDGTPAITRHAYDVPADQRARIFERDGMACLKCGDQSSLTIDHIVPLSKGGNNADANLQCLCHRCNSAKGDAIKSYVDEYAPSSPRTNSSKGQRRTIVDESCRPDSGFLIPDSGFLIPDCGLRNEDVPAQAPATPPARNSKKQRATSIPEDFAVSDRVAEWAAVKGFGQLDEHLAAFIRKAKAKGYTYQSWDDAFMEAIREDWAKLRTPGRAQQNTSRYAGAAAAIFEGADHV